MNSCAARRALVTDAAEVVELVGDMGELAPERRGPVVPRDLLDPAAARVLAALPARGTASPQDDRAGAPARRRTTRSRDCTNSAHWGSSNDTAMAGS